MKEFFDSQDTNGDGFVTEDEFKAFYANFEKQWDAEA